jgi:hypothetical protein
VTVRVFSLQDTRDEKPAADVPSENRAEAQLPLILHHDEHDAPPPPHGFGHEPVRQDGLEGESEDLLVPATDGGSEGQEGSDGTPIRLIPDPRDSVEDQLRALHHYLREVHTAEPKERPESRILSRFSRAFRPSEP